jgi:trk system potassium uptake protein
MRALIVGAGRLGRTLAGDLLHAGHDVRILDASATRLARLPTLLEGLTIHGSPLERAVLEGAVAGCDALAAVTDDDALNAVVGLAARRELQVPLAVAVIGSPTRAESLAGSGIRVVCPTARTAHELQLTLIRSGVESELELGGGTAVYRAELPARLDGRVLAELERSGKLVPVAVERAGRVLLAAPDLELHAGDVLHVAATHRDLVSDLTHP